MKNILISLPVIVVILSLKSEVVTAQCYASISGNACVGNLISAHYSGSDAKDVLWFRNGIPSMMRTNYSSYGEDITNGLDIPSGIAFDSDGNMYVTEYRLNAVVKFPKGSSTGFIVAGGNGKGMGLDQLDGPEDVQVDKNGNIFIADVYNYRIMKWVPGDSAGEVVAGGNGAGPGLNQLNWPNAISLDTAGNIYIADVYNNRIVKWAPGSVEGVVVAGGHDYGSAANQLYHPLGVFVDDSGYIYISDFLNYRIQKWAPGGIKGITVAGGYGPGDGPEKVIPEELFVDKQGNIFVIDSYSQGVKRWEQGKKTGYTVAGGYGLAYTPYHLYFPRGVYVDDQGAVFVAVGGDGEVGHGIVKKFEKTAVADTNYYTSGKPANYKAMIFAKSGCRPVSDIFKVIGIPQKPSPIAGLFTVAPDQHFISYSVIAKSDFTYNWTFPGGVQILSGQGTAVVTVNWGDSSGIVSVKALNSCGESDDRNAYVRVNAANKVSSFSAAISVSAEPVTANNFTVYPNPARDKVTVDFRALTEEKINLRLTDITGKLLLQRTIDATIGNNSSVLDVSAFVPGIYLVSIHGNRTGLITARILKQ